MSGSTSQVSSTNITPIYRLKRVLMGVANNLEQITGLTPLNDTNSTLNAKYGVQATVVPATHPTIEYFGIGIGGKRNVDSTNFSVPQEVSTLNMDIYTPIPFRMVPVEQDLDPDTRALYAMRRIVAVNGSNYAAYYLKRVTKNNAKVQFFTVDSSGNQQPYSLDYSNLNPTPPTTLVDGTVSDAGSEVNAVSVISVTVTGAEVQEAIEVLYQGQAMYGTISEIGLYTGTDQQVTTTDYKGNSFPYTEAILAQLHTHYTFNGFDMSTPNALYAEKFSFGSGRVILL